MRRRTLLTVGGASAAAAAFGALAFLAERGRPRRSSRRYGPLVPDPDGILDLPEGFRYRVLDRTGDAMDDGHRVPGRLDGMACFDGGDGRLVLMRNSEQTEVDRDTSPYAPGSSPPPEAYDPGAIGGVTRVVVDATSLERVSSNLVLTGTERNCAGGKSPWGWLSCEESVLERGGHRHGYVFLCPTDAARVQAPRRIDAYGRFNHEAVAIDPRTLVAYLTEDEVDACFYRFAPDDRGRPFEGRLQALAVVGADGVDTSNESSAAFPVGVPQPCRWVDVEDPDPPENVIRERARGRGAAMFSRTEGLWLADDEVWIAATDGGPAGLGQLFRYRPGGTAEEGGTLELVVESSDRGVLDRPDNVTVAPWGDVFLAEDDYSFDDNYLRCLTPQGELNAFARNVLNPGELAGVCFSPDGAVMFVNVYQPGLTLAVAGPFV